MTSGSSRHTYQEFKGIKTLKRINVTFFFFFFYMAALFIVDDTLCEMMCACQAVNIFSSRVAMMLSRGDHVFCSWAEWPGCIPFFPVAGV